VIETTLLGPIAPAEAFVIETATDLWESLVVDLDGDLGTDEALDLTLVKTPRPADIAGAIAFGALDGLPTGGIISFDDGSSWSFFVDPTPGASEEFLGVAGGPDHYGTFENSDRLEDLDLLSVILHELGHILGFTEVYPGWSAATDDATTTLDYGSGMVQLVGNEGPNGLNHVNALSHLAHADAPYDLMLAATYFPGPSGSDPGCARFLPPCGEESGGFGDRRLVSRLDLDILEGVYGFTVDRDALASVPEPGATPLVGLGLALLAGRRSALRRRAPRDRGAAR
jgi:hypothetical protein